MEPETESSMGTIFSHLSPVEPEMESSMGTIFSHLSPDAERVLVKVSLAGELSEIVSMIFEISHVLSSSKVQNAGGFIIVASKEGHYRILVSEKITRHETHGGAENYSFKLPEHLIVEQGGSSLTDEKWRQAGVILLREGACEFLPEEPHCPNLVVLCLHRNRNLGGIAGSFFSKMPSLRVVDLSGSRMRCLPPSLFERHDLQVLILCDCTLLNELPGEIRRLVALQVLDLTGTYIDQVPDEIKHLVRLKSLQLTLYGPDEESEYRYLPHKILSPNIFSSLQSLVALSIVVHPEDKRWITSAEAVVQYVKKLKRLSYLEFYFLEVELLMDFAKNSPSWPRIKGNKFKFVVGKNVKRLIDRVPNDVEIKYNRQDRCLKLVNGESAPDEALKEVLKCVTSFYLDHHQLARSLAELGISASKELVFCAVRECPSIEVIVMDDGDHLREPVFPTLEHLELHYLWKLETITRPLLPPGSFACLKSLGVYSCPIMEFVLPGSVFRLLCSLEELVVEGCKSVREIIIESDECILPPNLHKVRLYSLPQLLTFCQLRPETNLDQGFKSDLSVTVFACPMLDLNVLESIAEEVKVLNFETVFGGEDDIRVVPENLGLIGTSVTEITVVHEDLPPLDGRD